MSDFRIVRELATKGLRFAVDKVDTHMVDDVAHLAATRTKGVTNPLHVLSFGKLFRPSIVEKTTSQVVRGTGSGAFDDAVRALHQLGAKHSAAGISLSTDAKLYGGIKFTGTNYYISGQPVIDRIGRSAAYEIDAAARRVMDFV